MVAGNDRPGVMLAEAAARYLELYGVQAGRRVAVISNNAEGLRAATRLREAGVEVVAAIALGDVPCPPELAHEVFHSPKAISIRGGRGVRHVCVTGTDGRTVSLACDAVLMSGGFQPSVQLWTQASGRVQWSEAAQALLPVGAVDGVIICGAAAGTVGSSGATRQRDRSPATGALAVLAGLPDEPAERFGGPGIPCRGDIARELIRAGELAFVDIHNDVTQSDLELAMREGYRSIDHVKRYTTLGMGPDQGRTSARNGSRLTARDTPAPAIRTTTMRPPWCPVPFAAVAGTRAGPLASPWRSTLLMAWAKAAGAVFYESGPIGGGQATSRRRERRSPQQHARSNGSPAARRHLRLVPTGQDLCARPRQRSLSRSRLCRADRHDEADDRARRPHAAGGWPYLRRWRRVP